MLSQHSLKKLLFLTLAILPFIFPQVALPQNVAEDASPANPISIITLIAQPAVKTALRVQVEGYLVLDFEGEALYLHEEDYRARITKNAIRLSLSPEQEKQYKSLGGGYVLLEASFIKRRNSEDIFTGSLFNVVRIERKAVKPK
jgi:hypothetical protein